MDTVQMVAATGDSKRMQEAKAITPWLEEQLEALFPASKYGVTVKIASIIGENSIYIDVQNETKESMRKSNVAFWNATVSARITIKIDGKHSKVQDGDPWVVEMYNYSFEMKKIGAKMRKISAKTAKDAASKVVDYFKKWKDDFDKIEVSASSPSREAK